MKGKRGLNSQPHGGSVGDTDMTYRVSELRCHKSLTYHRVQPLPVGGGKAALLRAPAAPEDFGDKAVFRRQPGTELQGSPFQTLAVLGVAGLFAFFQCQVYIHGLDVPTCASSQGTA